MGASIPCRWICILACTLLQAACASFSDEGAIDYRKAQPVTAEELRQFRAKLVKIESENRDAQQPPDPAQQRSTEPSQPADQVSDSSQPLILTRLLRKDVEVQDSTAIVTKLDKVSIRLRDGFVHDCNEKGSVRRGFDKNCEIGLLFRAFELGDGQDFDFKPGAERGARLVYFSHDVRPGQALNLHNMPVYGPIEYKGRPLGIDMWMIEVDAEDQQSFALLKSLASAGAKAYPPAQPVVSVLEGLGSSLLNSGTDDIQFRYTFVLDPGGGYKGTVHATAEAGDYVFIRTQNRDTQVDWDHLFLDHNTGRVWIDRDGNKEPYRDNTYLSVQVLKNAGSEDVSLAQNTYGDFRDALERDTTAKAAKLQENLEPALNALALKRVQIRAFNQVQKRFEEMIAACDANQEAVWRSAAFDVLLQTQQAVKDLTCPTPPSKELKSDLSLEQLEYLLRRIRDRSDAKTEAELKQYRPDCKNLTEVKFEDFATAMCRKK